MDVTSSAFKENAKVALADPQLQKALVNLRAGFIEKRLKAVDALPEFDALRDSARDIKNHTLAHLDLYLEAYEDKLHAAGGELHYAETAEEAREVILSICRRVGAKTVTKGKSMVAEESHIIAPAVHLTKDQVEADFRRVHTDLPPGRDLSEPQALLSEARAVLRQRFLAADVGITGANFLVAETGSSVIVTCEPSGTASASMMQAVVPAAPATTESVCVPRASVTLK